MLKVIILAFRYTLIDTLRHGEVYIGKTHNSWPRHLLHQLNQVWLIHSEPAWCIFRDHFRGNKICCFIINLTFLANNASNNVKFYFFRGSSKWEVAFLWWLPNVLQQWNLERNMWDLENYLWHGWFNRSQAATVSVDLENVYLLYLIQKWNFK